MADYEYKAWMTPDGDFAGRIEVNTPVPQGLGPAPDGGCWGMAWNGSEWIEDLSSEARVEAFLAPPEVRLAAERAAMVCTKAQAMKALGPVIWSQLEAAVANADWNTRVDFTAASEWHRLHPLMTTLGAGLLGMTDAQIDDLFRLAATL